jgi:hypothetical protein
MKRKIVVLGLCFGLAACAAPFKDTRSPEELAAHVAAALNVVVGDYEVVDTRNDRAAKFAVVAVDGQDRSMNVVLVRRDGSVLVLNGRNCTGGYNVVERSGRVSCRGPSADIIYFAVDKNLDERKVTGSMFGESEPMTIAKGDYLLEYWESRGRPHYYLMKRK